MNRIMLLGLVICCTHLAACSNHVIRSTSHAPVQQATEAIPESLLLDVGITLFEPGLDKADTDDEDSVIFPEIRNAETRFIPFQLMETLQQSGAWGAVRMIPGEKSAVDITVSGEILHSDGELLRLAVTVTDASNKRWYTKEYESRASRYAYDKRAKIKDDPFKGLYNDIANDLLKFRRENLTAADIAQVRLISELRFAQDFSPDAFDRHVELNKKGVYAIHHLPAENDPMLLRVRRIRERDYLYVDTMQDYYGAFVKEMNRPYRQWRGQSYSEVVALRELKRSARNQKIAGVLTVLGGIAAAGSNNRSVRQAGNVAVAGGGYMVKSGFDKSAEAKLHVEALQELGDSLEAEIEPKVIELEDRTVTLSGTVENQYDQWRTILQEIYRTETGEGSNNQ